MASFQSPAAVHFPANVPPGFANDAVHPVPVAVKCLGCRARRLAVCDAVPEADLARLSAAAQVMKLEPGQRFLDEGEAEADFFIITEGTAKVLKMMVDGRQQITSFAGEGDFLGLAAEGRYAYSAEAVNRMKLCRFSRPRLRQLFAAFPQMERRLLARACHELVLAQEQMLLLGRKSARERMASFLITRAGAENPAGPVHVALPMNRNDIGDYLGLRIETVSRCLTQLKLKGVISIAANHGIVVRDMAALAGLSGSA